MSVANVFNGPVVNTPVVGDDLELQLAKQKAREEVDLLREHMNKRFDELRNIIDNLEEPGAREATGNAIDNLELPKVEEIARRSFCPDCTII